MKVFGLNLKGKQKRRKYPIKRDQSGRTARQRAFDLFSLGQRPSEVVEEVDISFRTACRYFQDWKKQSPLERLAYPQLQKTLKNDTGFRDQLITELADTMDWSANEVLQRMQKPWGIKQMLRDKWGYPARERFRDAAEWRLTSALQIVTYFEAVGLSQKSFRVVVAALLTELDDSLKQTGGSTKAAQSPVPPGRTPASQHPVRANHNVHAPGNSGLSRHRRGDGLHGTGSV